MRLYVLSLALLFAPSIGHAHVTVRPAEAQAGAAQTYTMRVPTEGQVNTTSVELEVPAGVAVTTVQGTAEMKREGGRITSITWKMDIPPGQAMAFTFEARNPTGVAQVAWRAHQHLADGTVTDWVDEPGSRRPASVTKLAAP